jgi:hypothetical protein
MRRMQYSGGECIQINFILCLFFKISFVSLSFIGLAFSF